MRIRIFRWKAIGVLVLFLALVGLVVFLFAEPVVKDTTEEAATKALGTQVTIAKLDIDAQKTALALQKLEIADPFNPMRNLIEAGTIRIQLNPEALAEKKVVIRQLLLSGLRFGSAREHAAKPVTGGGFAPQMLQAVQTWSKQFDVPILSLTPIDTIKQLILDPTQLGTVKAATALAGTVDSTKTALEKGIRDVPVEATVDSAKALATRLAATNPKTLGLDGTRRAITDVKRTLDQVKDLRKRVDGLAAQAQQGFGALTTGLTSLDAARRQDYAFAKGLLQLPNFAAPEIGKAFFGPVSIDRFKQAMYWAELARKYMPPGLLPREDEGPKRLRAAGTTVRFPKEHEYPSFLLEAGKLDFKLEDDGAAGDVLGGAFVGDYEASVRGFTTAPALYGQPMTFVARRSARKSALAMIAVDGVIDHRTDRSRDSVNALLDGIKLPSVQLPNLPFHVDPQRGRSTLAFSLKGDQVFARWSMASRAVKWTADSATPLNDVQGLVWRVLQGLNALDVTAELRGTMTAPKLDVSSNIDDAVAARIKAVIGEEVAKAEIKVRAKVDSLIDAKVQPIKQQVAALQADARTRFDAERAKLDDAQKNLEAELKRYGAPVDGLIKLPKVKL